MGLPILLVTATELEQRPLRARLGDGFGDRPLRWVVGGMGAGATAIAVARAVREQRPGLAIQAGIAGILPGTPLTLDDTVLVGSDRQADIGAWRPETGRFEAFGTLPEAHPVECPYVDGFRERFRVVGGRSANSACSPLPLREGEAVESMEGATFFAVCRDEGIPFLQLRALSNRTGDPRAEWRIPEALERLTEGLERLLDSLPDGLLNG